MQRIQNKTDDLSVSVRRTHGDIFHRRCATSYIAAECVQSLKKSRFLRQYNEDVTNRKLLICNLDAPLGCEAMNNITRTLVQ